ncbi:hypothetical protein LVJ84_08625 [Kingella potus]|nr:hypothetical protein [Kingella potus]UOP00055.1 hypothetical protein LVJ84_08625 [Kingella potus]
MCAVCTPQAGEGTNVRGRLKIPFSDGLYSALCVEINSVVYTTGWEK